jgi:hypothetical protein
MPGWALKSHDCTPCGLLELMALAAESSQAGRIWLSSAALFDLTAMCAAVAQLVEQRIRNAKVTSSIPVSGTNRFS